MIDFFIFITLLGMGSFFMGAGVSAILSRLETTIVDWTMIICGLLLIFSDWLFYLENLQ